MGCNRWPGSQITSFPAIRVFAPPEILSVSLTFPVFLPAVATKSLLALVVDQVFMP